MSDRTHTELQVRTCPNCAAPVPNGSDWCLDGHYAGWHDGTRTEDGSPAQAPLAVAPGLLVAVAGDAPERVVLERGQSETLRLNVRNQSDLVQRIRVEVDGLPDDCWSASPEEFGLNPWGQATTSDCEVAVELSARDGIPPGEYRVRIVVQASRSFVEVGAVGFTVDIRPFDDVAAELVTRRRVGFRSGQFEVSVHNRGTTTPLMELECVDADESLRFNPRRQWLSVPPGTTGEAPIRVRTRRWRLDGPAREWGFEVRVTADGAPVPGILPVSLRQRSLFPWLTAGLTSVVALAGIAAAIAAGTRQAPSPGPGPRSSQTATATPEPIPTPAPTETPATIATPAPSPAPTPSATPTPSPSPTATPASAPARVSLRGTISWPDGDPVADTAVAFLSAPDATNMIKAVTDSDGAYRLDDADAREPLRAVLFLDAGAIGDANDGQACVLPLTPAGSTAGDDWAVTPGETPATDWTTATNCLEDAASTEWRTDPEAATWEDVRDG